MSALFLLSCSGPAAIAVCLFKLQFNLVVKAPVVALMSKLTLRGEFRKSGNLNVLIYVGNQLFDQQRSSQVLVTCTLYLEIVEGSDW